LYSIVRVIAGMWISSDFTQVISPPLKISTTFVTAPKS